MSRDRAATNEYRLSMWAQIVKDRTKSGLTVKKYCEVNGYNRDMYFYWQRKLRETHVTGTAADRNETSALSAASAGWLSAWVTVADDAPCSGRIPIEIGRCRVVADSGTDMELLAKVCTTLVSIC